MGFEHHTPIFGNAARRILDLKAKVMEEVVREEKYTRSSKLSPMVITTKVLEQ